MISKELIHFSSYNILHFMYFYVLSEDLSVMIIICSD